MTFAGAAELQADRLETARRWWTRAGERGHTRATFHLGRLAFREGDEIAAATAWNTASEVREAKYGLGLLARNAGDHAEARRWWTAAAQEQGLVEAMFALAGLERDLGNDAEALRWWSAAAELDHLGALLQLGFRARKDDPSAADNYWTRARDLGSADASFYLGRLAWEQSREDEAIEHLRAAARGGRHEAVDVLRDIGAPIEDPTT